MLRIASRFHEELRLTVQFNVADFIRLLSTAKQRGFIIARDLMRHVGIWDETFKLWKHWTISISAKVFTRYFGRIGTESQAITTSAFADCYWFAHPLCF
jgi:hypothetical protein